MPINVGDIVLPPVNPEEEKWNTLVDQIIAGNVIPVIGSDIILDDCDINQFVINLLIKQYSINEKCTSFSELIYNPRFPKELRDSIYVWLDAFCSQNKNIRHSKLLERILSIKQFPFVITTSFFPIVENAMKKIWGENNVKTLIFDNNPTTTIKPGIGDINSEEDINTPTIYYMFGKHNKGANRFVVTDVDMLDFCKSWLTEGLRPPKLSNVLKKKYLLMLGNNYQDWLFRFIWYSMNMDNNSHVTNIQGAVINNYAEDSLVQFLNRIQTFIQKDPVNVIDRIENELRNRTEEKDIYFDKPQKNVEVFISYSRRNKEVADALYAALKDKRINVWYDKYDLCVGNNWMNDIKDAIESAKLFIPILSKDIVDEVNEFHPYRQEWRIALEHSYGYARTYICPIVEKEFNYIDARATEMKYIHSYIYDTPIFDKFANDIISVLDNLRSNE